MEACSVQYLVLGEWYTDAAAKNVNRLYAECVAAYHQERGRAVRIVEN